MVLMFREYGLFVKHCRVEVYLTELCLALNSDPENKIKMKFSNLVISLSYNLSFNIHSDPVSCA